MSLCNKIDLYKMWGVEQKINGFKVPPEDKYTQSG